MEVMPFKDKEYKRLYDKEWRQRAIENRQCMRCGIQLLEGEGKCCVNCSSKTTRNFVSIARRSI